MSKGKKAKGKDAVQTARTNANKRKAWAKHLAKNPADAQAKTQLGGKTYD